MSMHLWSWSAYRLRTDTKLYERVTNRMAVFLKRISEKLTYADFIDLPMNKTFGVSVTAERQHGTFYLVRMHIIRMENQEVVRQVAFMYDITPGNLAQMDANVQLLLGRVKGA
ncbi:MAG: hypothetical protein RSC43_00125 [Clostridia bacterium]